LSEQAPTIVVVDDDAEMTSVVCDVLRQAGYCPHGVQSAAAALDIIRRERPDLLISDLRMTGMSGHQLQQELQTIAPDLPVIIITAFGTVESAVESMKLGAFDFVTKPFSNRELLMVVARSLENRRLRQEVKQLRAELARSYGLDNIVATDPKMAAVLEMVERVAESPVTVLITGESGTGKDLLARALHFSSTRRDGPFIPINCAALPENLIESELFGYARGAFTDARHAKSGLFIAARGGTLFLDEVGEMPMALQSKLLRVIEDKKIRPLGATEETPVDVRIVAATNIDLEKATEQGRFRPDLYYRLSTVTLTVPPLRERPEDVPLLIRQFLLRASAESGCPVPEIDSQAMARLLRYPWPGNARELQNAIQRGIILARNNVLTIKELPPKVAGLDFSSTRMISDAVEKRLSLDQFEHDYIRAVVEAVNGNKTEAANILQIDRKTLYRKLEEISEEEAERH
jgi:DNA-binding NtrC family response regulator